jgi:O-antigen ligase
LEAPKSLWQRWLWRVGLLVLGFALAASESRGALLASMGGLAAYLVATRRVSDFARRMVFPMMGFLVYWMGASALGAESSTLIERGSSGRFAIYQHYLADFSGWDWLLGKGEVPMLPEAEMGWVVHHPHSAYLGQLVGYGLPAALALLAILGWGLWKLRDREEFSLYAFGLTAVLFDGGLIFSALSLARWEVLVVAVPLVMGLAQSERSERD